MQALFLSMWLYVAVLYCISNNWTPVFLGCTILLVVLISVLMKYVMRQVVYHHCMLIRTGLTLNEENNIAIFPEFRDHEGNIRNPYDNGCIKNCCSFWCTCKKAIEEPQMDIDRAPIIAHFSSTTKLSDQKASKIV